MFCSRRVRLDTTAALCQVPGARRGFESRGGSGDSKEWFVKPPWLGGDFQKNSMENWAESMAGPGSPAGGWNYQGQKGVERLKICWPGREFGSDDLQERQNGETGKRATEWEAQGRKALEREKQGERKGEGGR